MSIPFYNVYLVNRSINICNQGNKKLKTITLPILSITEVVFYTGIYNLTNGQAGDFETFSLIAGTMGKFKYIAQGILRETSSKYLKKIDFLTTTLTFKSFSKNISIFF